MTDAIAFLHTAQVHEPTYESLTREIAVIVQKIFVVYEERLLVFEQIKESCLAICKRSRFVLGSHHAVYKELIALKHAIM